MNANGIKPAGREHTRLSQLQFPSLVQVSPPDRPRGMVQLPGAGMHLSVKNQ